MIDATFGRDACTRIITDVGGAVSITPTPFIKEALRAISISTMG
jgi:hypothetical protein